jgi:transketolase
MVALQGYSESGPAEQLMVKCGLTPERVQAAAEAAIERKRG